jgi:hypothetical protein
MGRHMQGELDHLIGVATGTFDVSGTPEPDITGMA